MTTKFNWWVEILDVTYDFILGIKDILGTVDHKDETGDATGTLLPGNGINYALLAVWIRGNPGYIFYFYFYFFRYIFNMKLRQP